VDFHDEQRNGRPSILTDEVVAKIGNSVREDRRLTLDELHVFISELSRSLIHKAITEKLGYHKLCARWVPTQLTEKYKMN